jgi:hypothetical protein
MTMIVTITYAIFLMINPHGIFDSFSRSLRR